MEARLENFERKLSELGRDIRFVRDGLREIRDWMKRKDEEETRRVGREESTELLVNQNRNSEEEKGETNINPKGENMETERSRPEFGGRKIEMPLLSGEDPYGCHRFRGSQQGGPYEALMAIKQTGNVEENRQKFETISAPLPEVRDDIIAFMNGLKFETKAEVRLGQPGSLIQLIELAQKIEKKNWAEEKNWALDKLKNGLSASERPAGLGGVNEMGYTGNHGPDKNFKQGESGLKSSFVTSPLATSSSANANPFRPNSGNEQQRSPHFSAQASRNWNDRHLNAVLSDNQRNSNNTIQRPPTNSNFRREFPFKQMTEDEGSAGVEEREGVG